MVRVMSEEDFRAFLALVREHDERHGLALPFPYQVPEFVMKHLTKGQLAVMAEDLHHDISQYFGSWENFIGEGK